MPSDHVNLIDLHLTLQPCCWGLGDKAAAQASVMACTSDGLRPSSKAICRFERFRPMK